MKCLKILLILWAIFSPGLEARAQEPPPPPEGKVPVDISADHIAQDAKRNLIRAWGRVVIHFEDRVLRADRVTLNNETGNGEAVGNVTLSQADGTLLRAERALFNTKTKQGRIFQSRGRITKNYFVSGKKVTRHSESHYKLEDSTLTTCHGAVPDWQFAASSVDWVTNDRALFTGGVFKVKNIPILYVPVGYIPINRERKSGFLMPSLGTSNTDGFTFEGAYYWAINRWSDATFGIDYLENRGVRPEVEYRYTPSPTTRGEIRGSFLEDDLTGRTFWKIDATHEQNLPLGFQFNGKLDLESESSFNKTFEDNPDLRTRRSSDSFASISRTWTNHSLDILTRFRESTEFDRDDTFGLLPEVTFNTQRIAIGDSNFYFNQDTNFTSFLTDLNADPIVDDQFMVQRFDFHPQVSARFNPFAWLALTPTLGLRETYYSDGIDATGTRHTRFSRESFDVAVDLEGPKVNKVFHTGSTRIPKLKHVIEPRVSYSFIPDIDENDRRKIKVFDAIDSLQPESLVTYSLTQRLLQKERLDDDAFQSREILRFEVSQSYDLREATEALTPQQREPFSDLRFDLDSRIIEPLLLNFDTTYDVHSDAINTLNFEVGVKPTSNLMMFVERRFTRGDSTFLTGTIDWAFLKGW
ncbi:MAG: hypothetical protein GWM98_20840, partial [Nitrospinaceae bacterium]|nr:LPS-assembly protein LptD [Nitrospinaceae bacterium]NIR56470.1 LPS-assembly protein LptD [Nitrospinaceae bacterium]NIS86931.1 LPS-assembly protein LptD [Nitrospinaceae bacterium]NIT83769.1 LPS-assembly protein LptD [Nitrospinaceae bacterium]NIU45972.1 LPS-assembly protein LptD [Nitrospinaceae bacterium]